MRKTGTLASWILTLLLLCITAQADDWSISYQAYLTDEDGAPVDSAVTIQFDAYTTDFGGSSLWTKHQIVDADQGLIATNLGSPANPFPAGLFDSSVFIGITINGEELQPRKQLVSSAFSFRAANSDLLSGQPASDFDQSTEVHGLQDQMATQNDRLNAIESSPSDITAVIAGDGLTGGAQSGSATISLAAGGVTAANMSFNAISGGAIQAGAVNSIKIENGTVAAIDLAADSVNSSKIADHSITSIDIADGTVGPNDINGQAGFNFGAINVQSDGNMGGDLQVAGRVVVNEDLVLGGGATINGSINLSGSASLIGDITTNSSIEAGKDLVVAEDVLVGDNVTIGGDANISGALGIGFVQVQKSLSTVGPQYLCDKSEKCKRFSAEAQCPSGFMAVSGGVEMAVSDLAKILVSRPGNNASTSWQCATQDSFDAPVNDSCYANCLRISGL